MYSLYAIAASLTLILPFMGQDHWASAPAEAVPAAVSKAPAFSAPQSPAPLCQSSQLNAPDVPQPANNSKAPPSQGELPQSRLSASNPLDALYKSGSANQVRIERRVTIRITPYRQSNRNSLLAQLPRRGVTRAYEEREVARCVPVSGIAGVQTSTGNRLLLFLRDERILSVNLARGCEARDFYSGFYVERNDDGRLCVKRDLLQSRSGAKCEVERMRRLVLVDD